MGSLPLPGLPSYTGHPFQTGGVGSPYNPGRQRRRKPDRGPAAGVAGLFPRGYPLGGHALDAAASVQQQRFMRTLLGVGVPTLGPDGAAAAHDPNGHDASAHDSAAAAADGQELPPQANGGEGGGSALQLDALPLVLRPPPTPETALAHFLAWPPARRWVTYEWLYSSIDRPFYLRTELTELLSAVGLGHVSKMTRGEWALLRKAWGRPRRLSLAFLKEERAKLEGYRCDAAAAGSLGLLAAGAGARLGARARRRRAEQRRRGRATAAPRAPLALRSVVTGALPLDGCPACAPHAPLVARSFPWARAAAVARRVASPCACAWRAWHAGGTCARSTRSWAWAPRCRPSCPSRSRWASRSSRGTPPASSCTTASSSPSRRTSTGANPRRYTRSFCCSMRACISHWRNGPSTRSGRSIGMRQAQRGTTPRPRHVGVRPDRGTTPRPHHVGVRPERGTTPRPHHVGVRPDTAPFPPSHSRCAGCSSTAPSS